MDTCIIIPAFNEEKKISSVVQNLQNKGYNEIIVVNDGSRDKTKQNALKSGAIVLTHCINRGQGAALATGIEYAIRKDAKIIITFDADGQHQPEDIEKLIEAINAGYDVALGSRFLNNKSNTPFIRKIILKGGALIHKIFYNVKLTDSHNGLRALSNKAARTIRITQDRMEHASEIIEEIGKKKLSYKEVPVTIRYTDYSLKHGQRSSNAFKILFKMIIKKFLR